MKINKEYEQEYNKFKENNQDFYGAGVVRFAERWADAMEQEIEKIGNISKDKAQGLSHKCDTEGITGFQYGYAKAVLKQWWLYGNIFSKEDWDKL